MPKLNGDGVFIYDCSLLIGFRYRYMFVWKDILVIDKCKGSKYQESMGEHGGENNYIEVAEGKQDKYYDFFSLHNPHFTKEEI